MNKSDQDRLNEKALEDVVVASLATSPLFTQRPAESFDAASLLDVDETASFLQTTQPKEWTKLEKQFPGAERATLASQLAAVLQKRGTLEVLRSGGEFQRH